MKKIIKTFNETDHNYVFSPVSVYHALAILAQTTNAETKQEILDAIGVSEDELINCVKELNNQLNINAGKGKLSMNSSLWLSDSLNTNDETIEKISKNNNCVIKKVPMGTKEANKEVQHWVNENTNNLLKDSVESIETGIDTLFQLYSTIYLKGNWDIEFDAKDTKKDVFHKSINEDIKCDFMNQCLRTDMYEGKRFKAIALYIRGIARATFILPNDGLSPSDIANDEDLLKLLEGDTKGLDSKEYIVNLSLPKFDVTFDGDILEKLSKLGIQKATVMGEADFSPISNEKNLYLNKAKQAARLKIDEDGVEASAFTMLDAICAGIILTTPEEIDFKLDRPFMFSLNKSIKNKTVPLFVGTVVDPRG